MLYFIPWAVFLLFVILAIPVTLMMENRKYRSGKPSKSRRKEVDEPLGEESASEEFTGDDDAEMVGDAVDDFGAFADSTPAGGDDFSAFEEEFK